MKREAFESRLLDLIEGRLTEEDAQAIREELGSEPKLARKVQKMARDRENLIAERGREPSPARGLVELAIAESERRALLETRPDQSGSTRSPLRWVALAAALSFAALGAVAIWIGTGSLMRPKLHPEVAAELGLTENDPDAQAAPGDHAQFAFETTADPTLAPGEAALIQSLPEPLDADSTSDSELWIARLREDIDATSSNNAADVIASQIQPVTEDAHVWDRTEAAQLAQIGRLNLVLISASDVNIRGVLSDVHLMGASVPVRFIDDPWVPSEGAGPGIDLVKPAQTEFLALPPADARAESSAVSSSHRAPLIGYIEFAVAEDRQAEMIARAIDDLVWWLDAGDLAIRLERTEMPDELVLGAVRPATDTELAQWPTPEPMIAEPRVVLPIPVRVESATR